MPSDKQEPPPIILLVFLLRAMMIAAHNQDLRTVRPGARDCPEVGKFAHLMIHQSLETPQAVRGWLQGSLNSSCRWHRFSTDGRR